MEHIIFDVQNLVTQQDESHSRKGIGILHSEKLAGFLLALRLEFLHLSPSPSVALSLHVNYLRSMHIKNTDGDFWQITLTSAEP